ncbi:MAG: riboflavin synthase [Hydrogenophilales bacterium CG03_land_8_20_14_0_80_62_28]|nr:MAG: riboflavin synthase subunit alpha [Hydrogenophilaceae bacterium CG1_02_62_390]PIV21757.1 MAG: riboflavin synthase [Hydrogenophilales bacterium CG03_land_8_20_14_0_80_62_28]PIW37653.1 MAG: riboflavin synthase [Hydrogenophilales bacterium CG15_BIG_FIL_POST_REV_8_21_14_020_62_31]PIW72953.1 MAG: riboflavin synthase [Hydrogenophilales bacterium CG12_big_fil_rev_8_21_14_0_65_61_21]PIX01290.1 MAG: riboflavin synthase [Hydrogenophilales bacterium CG_4_8_14_3_um_filter_62_83]
MFTGIIQAVGHIHSLTEKGGGDARVTIAGGGLNLNDVALGDSIACNGVCLTVVERTAEHYSVDVSAETFNCTTGFAPGEAVNLEKALRLSDHLGGHLVSGHVDGVGEVIHFAPVSAADQAASWRLDVRAPGALARYIAVKGSVAVNGVSLTVNTVHGDEFSINLIPHTLENTMLGRLKTGSKVNLEADMLARYAERLLAYTNEPDKD